MNFSKFGPALIVGAVASCGIAFADEHATVPPPEYDGPQFYGKLGVGNATELAIEGHFFGECNPDPEVEGCDYGDHETESFELDGGLVAGAAVGADFGYLRIEAGLDRTDANALADTVDIDATVAHGTVFVDVPLGEYFEVFGGLGADYAAAEATLMNDLIGSVDGDGTGYHFEAGAAYKLSDRVTLEASYRNTHTEYEFDLGDDETFDLEADTQVLRAGLRLAFG